jgi:tRNA A-37 threonylcarbamoyl transferase component Bud32
MKQKRLIYPAKFIVSIKQFFQGEELNKESSGPNGEVHQQVLDFCRHIAGSAEITAVSTLGNYATGTSSTKTTSETMLVIRDFQPRLMSYVKILNGKSVIFFAVDQWVFERDVDRGFLGEALAGALIFPYVPIHGKEYLHKQEILLKKRLILELLENLVLSFPDLAPQLHIKPEYFMYEVMLNRVRVFPPLAYGKSNFMNGAISKTEVKTTFSGYMEALQQLEKENKIVLSNGYVTVPKKLVAESKNPKVRLTNISKNAPRTLFTSVLSSFPQLLNFFSQNIEVLLKLQKFTAKKETDPGRCFVNPQKFVFVPTAEGLVSLADRINMVAYARKMLLDDEKTKITFEPVGGVLNDLYLIRASANGEERKVLVKRFKDWSGFKWFPLSIWSFGARSLAVVGRTRLEKECAIGEFLRCNGIRVPKILHVSHSERLVFMEFIEGENLSSAIKRITRAKTRSKAADDLAKIEKVGEVYAKVHALNVTLGDTKPENVMFDPSDNVYLLDFEQASHEGDKTWDVAVFLYYAGHYLQPMYNSGKAEAITEAFVNGYLKGGGDAATIRKVSHPKYTRIFSVFTMPSIMLAMSNVCKKTKRSEKE